MSMDPTRPPALEDEIRDLRRRLSALERANPLRRAVAADDNGIVRTRVGPFLSTDIIHGVEQREDFGFEVSNSTGDVVFAVGNDGQIVPWNNRIITFQRLTRGPNESSNFDGSAPFDTSFQTLDPWWYGNGFGFTGNYKNVYTELGELAIDNDPSPVYEIPTVWAYNDGYECWYRLVAYDRPNGLSGGFVVDDTVYPWVRINPDDRPTTLPSNYYRIEDTGYAGILWRGAQEVKPDPFTAWRLQTRMVYTGPVDPVEGIEWVKLRAQNFYVAPTPRPIRGYPPGEVPAGAQAQADIDFARFVVDPL